MCEVQVSLFLCQNRGVKLQSHACQTKQLSWGYGQTMYEALQLQDNDVMIHVPKYIFV